MRSKAKETLQPRAVLCVERPVETALNGFTHSVLFVSTPHRLVLNA